MRKLRDITVSDIGMGCMGFSHGYGDIPDEAYSIEAIRKAYEFGFRIFTEPPMSEAPGRDIQVTVSKSDGTKEVAILGLIE